MVDPYNMWRFTFSNPLRVDPKEERRGESESPDYYESSFSNWVTREGVLAKSMELQDITQYLQQLGIDPQTFTKPPPPRLNDPPASEAQPEPDPDNSMDYQIALVPHLERSPPSSSRGILGGTTALQETTSSACHCWSPCPNHTYFVYTGQKQELDPKDDVYFYVESINVCKSTPKSSFFQPTVKAWNGSLFNVTVTLDGFQTNRYICSFRPGPTGEYSVHVKDGNGKNKHIQGSPLSITVMAKAELDKPKNFRLMKDMDSGLYPALDNIPSSIKYLPRTLQPRQFSRPWGVAVHPCSQNIYVTDADAHEVLRYKYSFQDQSIIQISRFGFFGTELRCFRSPCGIAVDNTKNRVLIADKDNHRISIFSLDGLLLKTFGREGSGNGEFHYPYDVAVSPDGYFIAVADSLNSRIQIFDHRGVYLRQCAIVDDEQPGNKPENPRNITFKGTGGVVLVTAFNVPTIFAYSTDLKKNFIMSSTGLVNIPKGIAMTGTGSILVGDTQANSVRTISGDGILVKDILKAGNDLLDQPINVATAAGGLICVLETSGAIRLFQAQD